MAALKIIGDVGVKVRPDTTKFKKELQAKLNKIEKQLDPIKVKVVPEIDQSAKQKLKKELARLKRELDGKNINFGTDLDSGTVRSELKQLKLELNGETIEFGPVLDHLGAAKLRGEVEALERSLSGNRIKFGAELDNGDLVQIETVLKVLTRGRDIKINTKFSAKSVANILETAIALGGLRVQLDGLAEGYEKLKRIDYIAMKMAVISAAAMQLSSHMLALTATTFGVAGGLVKIGAAGLALPGLLTGMAIGFGATLVALMDINKEVPKLSKHMQKLKKTISGSFWKQARDSIRELADKAFPILNKSIDKTAEASGKFFSNLATNIQATLLPRLKGMFDSLNESIQIGSEHTQGLADMIAILGTLGATYLPRLAEWFFQLTDSMAAFLQKNEENGNLFKWVDEGIANLQALWSILVSTAGVLTGVWNAAMNAGAMDLEGLANKMRDVAAYVNSPEFQTPMTEVFRAALNSVRAFRAEAGPGVSAGLAAIRDAFIAHAPGMGKALGNLFGKVGEAISSPKNKKRIDEFFNSVRRGIDHVTKAAVAAVDILSSFAELAGKVFENITKVMASGVERMAPTLTSIFDAAGPVVDQLGELFATMSDDLIPVFETAGEGVAKFVAALSPLIAQIQRVWNIIAPVLVPILTLLADIIWTSLTGAVQGLTMVFKGVGDVIEGAIGIVTGFYDAIVGLFTGDWSQMTAGLTAIWDGLVSIITGAVTAAFGAVWTWANVTIVGAIRSGGLKLLVSSKAVWTGLKNLIKNTGTAIVNLAKSMGSKVGSLISSAWNAIKSKTAAVWAAVAVVIGDKITQARDKVSDIGGKIKSKLSSIWEAIKTTASSKWEALKTILGNKITGARDKVSQMVEKIKTKMSDTWTAIKERVRTAWEDVKTIIGNKITDTVEKVKKLPQRAKDGLGDLSSKLTQAGKDLIAGFISGIAAKFTDVRNKLQELTSKLTSWKGPEERDKVLLTPVGQMIIDSLIAGFESRFGAVRNSLSTLTNSISRDFDGRSIRMGVESDISTPDGIGMAGLSSSINASLADKSAGSGNIQIDNITIPLEDLEQLRTLDDFMNMLRVRTRQGVLA